MTRIYTISDVHGKLTEYRRLIDGINAVDKDCIIFGLGDFGYGYINNGDKIKPLDLPDNVYQCLGNHDNRDFAKDYKNIIHAYKYFQEYDIFVVPGAETPSHLMTRYPGINWFENEEMTKEECEEAFFLYRQIKPKIVISHDAPLVSINHLGSEIYSRSRTGQLLDAMWEEHKPEHFVHGHWHKYIQKDILGCTFSCRPELQIYEITEKRSVHI